jgi:hypothetical protein
MKDKIQTAQQKLIDIGLLDPPADGVFGVISQWAMAEAGIEDKADAADLDDIVAQTQELEPLPLNILTNDLAGRIVRAMQRHRHWVCRHPKCFNIVYVEGMDLNGKANKNVPNHFNDLRCLIQISHDGTPKMVDRWIATTEPGKYWTEKPMNPKGAARLAFGQYKAWCVGMHNRNHEALVQVRQVPVYRDPKKLYKRYGDKHVGLFGINQHWGYDLPQNDLGRSSAGCLVGRTKDGHRQFMKIVKSDARYKAAGGAYRFVTTLLPAAEVI